MKQNLHKIIIEVTLGNSDYTGNHRQLCWIFGYFLSLYPKKRVLIILHINFKNRTKDVHHLIMVYSDVTGFLLDHKLNTLTCDSLPFFFFFFLYLPSCSSILSGIHF